MSYTSLHWTLSYHFAHKLKKANKKDKLIQAKTNDIDLEAWKMSKYEIGCRDYKKYYMEGGYMHYFQKKNLLGTVLCFRSIDLNASFNVFWFFCNLAKTRLLCMSNFSLVTCTELRSSFEALVIITKQTANKNKKNVFEDMSLSYNFDETSPTALGFASRTKYAQISLWICSLLYAYHRL